MAGIPQSIGWSSLGKSSGGGGGEGSSALGDRKVQKGVKGFDKMLGKLTKVNPYTIALSKIMILLEPFLSLLDLFNPVLEYLAGIFEQMLMPVVQALMPLIMLFIDILDELKPTFMMIGEILGNYVGRIVQALIPVIIAIFDVIKPFLPLIEELTPLFDLLFLLMFPFLPLLEALIPLIELLVPVIWFVVHGIRALINVINDIDKAIDNAIGWINDLIDALNSGGGCCFPEDAPILMWDNSIKEIQDVKIGDYVVCFDFSDNSYKKGEVCDIEKPIRDHICILEFDNGKKMELTIEHPIYTSTGWKSLNPLYTLKENNDLHIKTLKINDNVKFIDGFSRIIKIEYHKMQIQTYNLKTIKDYHNFYAYDILVHNKGGGCCFPTGTKIHMSNHTFKEIQDIKIGAYVLSYDFEKNELIPCKVLEIEAPIRDHICTIIFENNEQLQLTDEHPIFTKKGWKSIEPMNTYKENNSLVVNKLKKGDLVKKINNEFIKIKEIRKENKEIQTYNLKTIEKTHNYFAEGCLVHNKGEWWDLGLATGGYVPPSTQGTVARLGEGGEGEWVIPESLLGEGGSNTESLVYQEGTYNEIREMNERQRRRNRYNPYTGGRY